MSYLSLRSSIGFLATNMDQTSPFVSAFSTLQEHPAIRVTPGSAALVDFTDTDLFTIELKHILGNLAGKEVEQMYAIPELIKVHWTNAPDIKLRVGGEINLTNLMVALVNNTPEGLDYVLNAQQMRSFRVIDSHPHAGDGQIVFLEIGAGVQSIATLPLHFLDENGGLHPLSLTYFQYVDRCRETLGFFNWQLLFIENAALDKNDRHWIYEHMYAPTLSFFNKYLKRTVSEDLRQRITAFKK